MKKLLLLAVLIGGLASCSWLSADHFTLSGQVYANKHIAFKPHVGKGRLDSYLAMQVNYPPIEDFRIRWERRLSHPLKHRGEAHITVITPIEFNQILSKKLTMEEINKVARDNNLQSSKFEVVCLAEGELRLRDNTSEYTYFLVVKSPDLEAVRFKIHQLYVKKGGRSKDWFPQSYYPHITFGFTQRDLHESDGVIKNEASCIKKIKIID
jgi:hypothetical protein